MRIPFGRMMLFFIITAGLFGAFSIFRDVHPIFRLYSTVAGFSLMAAAVCLVIWLAITLFQPATLLMPGRSLNDVDWLYRIFYGAPYFRIALLSLVASVVLAWLHGLVFPLGITVFLVSFEMFIARLLFFVYGSAGSNR